MKNKSIDTNQQSSYLLSITIIGALFFIFGFVTWLNGILIPYLKIACELNNFQSYFVAFSFYISYFFMALPSAWVLGKTGFKNGMILGLLIMALGALLFIPAALTRQYGLFLTGLFVVGTGLSILQTASNPYITKLGPMESAAKRIGIMGICNKVAGVISPLILGAIVLKDSDKLTTNLMSMDAAQNVIELNALASRVITPYIVMALILIGLALMIRFSKLPDIDKKNGENSKSSESSDKKSIWQHRNLIMGVITLFLYVGVEVIAGDTIINFGVSEGVQLSTAKVFTSYTLISMVIGYIIGIVAIPRFIRQANALAVSAVLGLIFSLVAIISHGWTSIFFIAVLGFANAMMWPAIWPLAIDGLGKYTKIGSSMLIMAIAGGALLPLLYGKLADIFSPHNAYWIMIPCYLVIFYYAVSGHKIRKA